MPDVQNYKCIVRNCTSNGNRNIRFYGFPFIFPDIMQRWKENLRIENMSIKRYMNVCDRHFEPNVLGKRKVLKGAVPTLNLGHPFGPKHISQLTRHRPKTYPGSPNVVDYASHRSKSHPASQNVTEYVGEGIDQKVLDNIKCEEETLQYVEEYEEEYLEVEDRFPGPPPLRFYTPTEIVLHAMQSGSEIDDDDAEFIMINDDNQPIRKEHNYTGCRSDIPPLAYFDETTRDSNDSVEYILAYEDDDEDNESDHYVIEYGEDDALAHEI